VAKTVLSCCSVIFKHLAFDKLAGKRVVTAVCIDQKQGNTYVSVLYSSPNIIGNHTLCDRYTNGDVPYKHYSGNQTNTNELDGTCGTYTGEEKCGRGFGGGNQRQGDHLDYLGVDGFSGNWGGGGNGLN